MIFYCKNCNHKITKKKYIFEEKFFFYIGVSKSLKLLNKFKKKSNLRILECNNCGLLYQDISQANLKFLDKIYTSKLSNISTNMDDSNMGRDRFNRTISKIFFKNKPKNILEIGSQDSFFLNYLNKEFNCRCVGIEPSYKKNSYIKKNVKIIKGFFDSKINLKENFDTFICLWTLEHIVNIKDFFETINKLKNPNFTQLIISVPNTNSQILNGDPGIFIHEHINYFNKNSLTNILNFFNFELESYKEDKTDIYFTAVSKKIDFKYHKSNLSLISLYRKNLKLRVNKIKFINKYKKIALWGACPTTINLLNIFNLKYFSILDADYYKHGKYISGSSKKILNPKSINFNTFDKIILLPLGFSLSEKKYYLNKYPKIFIDFFK